MGSYVARVDEDVAIGDLAWVQRVGVGNADNADRSLMASRRRTEKGEDVVEEAGEEM